MSYAITGIPMPAQPDPQHPIPLRKEVTAWASDPENAVQLSLFIQALTTFQQMDVSEQLSYYQIAGIHGQPAASWDGAAADSSARWYCNHNLTTFPTWHRPYMLLFEQRLYEIMMGIVKNIQPASEQSIWAIEASHWRLPYWDWAAEQPYLQSVGVPQIFTLPQITVVMPNSGSHIFANPLWMFKNPKGVSFGDTSMGTMKITAAAAPFNEAFATSRHGSTSNMATWAQGINNFTGANSSIASHKWGAPLSGSGQPNYAISDLVSRLLTDNYLKSWRYFSSTLHSGEGKNVPTPTDFLSLEAIHNNIHVFTGGGGGADGLGHMVTPTIASFDPIFWLHHCNVDRQFAMWQTLNPTKWFDNLNPTDTGPTSPLTPFHKDNKYTVFNSNDIRQWTSLNYQYDVLENTPRWIRAQTQGQVTDDHISDHVRRTVNMHLNKSRQAVLNSPQLQGKENDYIINVVYDRYALGGAPYSIYFFLGPAPDQLPEGTTYHDLPYYVGSIYTFSSTQEVEDSGTCPNCVEQRNAKVMSKAQVVLTLKLIDHANNPDIQELNSLQPHDVESYLKKHLTWKAVEAITGRIVPLEGLPRTKVYVLGGKAQHSEDPQQMSQYGEYSHLFGATEGKVGGAAQNDQGAHMEL